MKLSKEHGSESESASVSVETLREELEGTIRPEEPETAVAETVDEVETLLFGSESFSYEEAYVKLSLEELLISLVALREANTHGKQLLDDLGEQFGTMLSSGTVYPQLYDLCEEGILDRRELVKTKEYVFDDPETGRNTVADAASQHIALGMVFRAVLKNASFDTDE